MSMQNNQPLALKSVIRCTNLEFVTLCEARFAFSHLEFPQKYSPAAERGILLHSILEHYVNNKLEELDKKTIEGNEWFIQSMDRWWNSYPKVLISAEKRLTHPVTDSKFDTLFMCSGKYDMIISTETEKKIIDLKTGKNVEPYLYTLQLPMYSILTYKETGELITKVAILDVVGNEYERTLTKDDYLYAIHVFELACVLLQRGVFQKTYNCNYCDYYSFCITINRGYITLQELVELRKQVTEVL